MPAMNAAGKVTAGANAMQELQGKVAVITGAGSGFGRELAVLCASEGMALTLTDIDEASLVATRDLLPEGSRVLLIGGDVGDPVTLENVAKQTYAEFGAAHLLFNNAGVALAGPIWTSTLEEWKWTLDVNLMGVVHGIRSFVPRMLEQGDECHVVNTASVAALLSVPGSASYCVSKHGVLTISECLYHELHMVDANIGVSVLCPAFVKTGIADSARNRPDELAASNPHPLTQAMDEVMRTAVEKGKISAREVAEVTLDAVKNNRFYILTHNNIKGAVEARVRHILDDKQPHNSMTQGKQ